MKKKIGIIGFGNMGSAIAERIKTEYEVFVFDKDKDKTNHLSGIEVARDIINLINIADIVILAVKPQDFDIVLNEIKDYVKNKLTISIAAGISTRYIEKILGGIRVMRVMPNIGIKIGKSISCLSKGKFATRQDLSFTGKLFGFLGKTEILKEEMMNFATAISGSGPGYYFDKRESSPEEYKNNSKQFNNVFIRDLTKAAKEIGFDARTAKVLAHWTVIYSDLLINDTKLSPGELKSQVTSKGGTTLAALEVLHKGGTLTDAVKAAAKKAEELTKN